MYFLKGLLRVGKEGLGGGKPSDDVCVLIGGLLGERSWFSLSSSPSIFC